MPNHATYAEVNLAALDQNLRTLKKRLSPKTKLLAIVKANAYGHGSVSIAKQAIASGAHYLGVATLGEALELRSAGIRSPILLLSEIQPEEAEIGVANDLSQTVYSLSLAHALAQAATRLGKTIKIHIKVDTGMGRIGLLPSDTPLLVEHLQTLSHLFVEGIFTHLANAHDARKVSSQLGEFEAVLSTLALRNLKIPIRHIGNTASTLLFPETHLDMVRIGIGLYGIYPHPNTKKICSLSPVLSFKTKVAYVKPVPADFTLSYGSTYQTPRATRIATLPVGYADGLSRGLSNIGQVIIRGKKFPLVGAICMDMTLVDLKGDPHIQPGDEAVLIGAQNGATISAEEVAKLDNTIPYEVVCGIGKRVPRVYLEKRNVLSNTLSNLSSANV